MRPIEFTHGYAGDVAVSAGTVWVAWAEPARPTS